MPALALRLIGAAEAAAKLRALSESLATDVLTKATQAAALVVLTDAQRRAPVRTGSLRRSLHMETVQATRSLTIVAVGTSLSYAPLVEYGTRAHTIYPRTKRALYWPGARHPVRRVNHPGTPPRPFLLPALTENVARIRAEALAALQALLARL